MPGDKNVNPAPSLREIAEQAYDDLENGAADAGASEGSDDTAAAESDGAPQETLASDDRPRDKAGRWVSRSGEAQPGEAIEPLDPAPKPKVQATETQTPTAPDPAAAPPAARSNQAPEHWSAEDKATFAKLPEDGRAFLLKRHGEMEAEFTRKSQASAGAVQFAQALAPVFTDPHIAGTLKQAGLNPAQAVTEWAQFFRMGTSPNQQDKFTLLVNLTQRMGLDPARIFAALQNQPPPLPAGMTEADLKDPAIKFFADHLGKTTNDLAALRGELQQMRQAEQAARQDMGLRSARAGVDGFADEKGKDGKPLRPHFDAVLPLVIDLFKANPNRDLHEAYETACWAHPEVRKQLLAAQHAQQRTAEDLQRAQRAQRGNTRGLTAPVSRPNGVDQGATKGSLRDAIERSAEDIGF